MEWVVTENVTAISSCIEANSSALLSTGAISISFALATIDLLVILGNSLVVSAVFVVASLRTTTNCLITSLAVSDLLIGVLVVPLSIADTVLPSWNLGPVICRLWIAMDVFFSTASIYNLVMISIDRFLAVTEPMKYTLIYSSRLGKLFTSLAWGLALMVSSPLLMSWIFIDSDPESLLEGLGDCPRCTLLKYYPGYIAGSSVCSFIVPLLVLSVLNVGIYRKVRLSKTLKLNIKKMPKSNGNPEDTEQLATDSLKRARKFNGASRTEIRVARTVCIVVGCFLICWVPFCTVHLLQAYELCSIKNGCMPESVYVVFVWLGYFNSALNPLIYGVFSRDFRRGFRKVFQSACNENNSSLGGVYRNSAADDSDLGQFQVPMMSLATLPNMNKSRASFNDALVAL